MKEITELPVLPLRDAVVFPKMVLPLFVGRASSMAAVERAMASESRQILLVAQKDLEAKNPSPQDLYETGCVAQLLQVLKLPDGSQKVLAEGKFRAKIVECFQAGDHFEAQFLSADDEITEERKILALRRVLLSQLEQFIKLHRKLPSELLMSLSSIEDNGSLADSIAAHLPLKLEVKQELLGMVLVKERLEKLLTQLEAEIEILHVEKRVRMRAKQQMEKNQRDFYLNEQMKAIQRELSDGEDGLDLDELGKKIEKAGMTQEAKTKAKSELRKLKMMSPMSAEASVVRSFIEALIELPWNKKTKTSRNLPQAQKVLDAEHYGLEKVKDRIVEYLAVQQRVDKVKAPILCLVGPPGVGKTSLGQSIARATNRKFVRMALGGIHDEAEIRGHRRTYIGSMPGKVLQNLTKVGVRNPLFLLDEVDKLGHDFRGDPASALLEVLDPEQNSTFEDHYIEVDFDLSDVMFVATANSLDIPPALLDRMEVIRLSGYTEDEKIAIAERYLLPKQLKNNGLKEGEIKIEKGVLQDIVRYYTREAGVRSLEREISKICRKVVKSVLLRNQNQQNQENQPNQAHSKTHKKKKSFGAISVNSKNLSDFLGVRRFTFGVAEKENQVGQVTGLAWTEVGGEILTIECATMPGKGNIIRTGSLGDVMKESVEAARTVVRARATQLGIFADDFEKLDIHIHVPEGATPKDGPSAGIAMTTALVSAFTKIPVKCNVCMTGEITLRGEVLAIGGLKEKLLAAIRGNLKTALIPEENVKDLAEMPANIKDNIEIVPVKWIDDVLKYALERAPEPLKEESQTAENEADIASAMIPAPLSSDVRHSAIKRLRR